MLTQEGLKNLLRYDPETGVFIWRVRKSKKIAPGCRAGTVRSDGHRRITIDGRKLRESRLAWLYMTGEWPHLQVDHRDLDTQNNRWANLRRATPSQNSCNTAARTSLGVKGITPVKNGFQTQITANGKTEYLGVFSTIEKAHAAYVERGKVLHGEFFRAG